MAHHISLLMKSDACPGASRRAFLLSSGAGLCAVGTGCLFLRRNCQAAVGSGGLVRLKHNPEAGSYDFETEAMSGSIKTEGAYHGVTRLIDKQTGRQVIDPRYSALNLFRLFAVNLGMGTPRSMDRKIQATESAVEITWPSTDAHLGEIRARYEVRQPHAIDLVVTVRSKASYAGYEVLLPSYFDKVLVPHVFLKRRTTGTNSTGADIVVPMVSDVFRGGALAFPRDAHAARRMVDGRWERSEFKSSTAPFYPLRQYAHPLAFVSDPDRKMAAVLMTRRESCSSVSSRYFAERDEDRATSYTAIDFFLFGEDLVPGDERTTRVRLALTPLDEAKSQPLKLYESFLAETLPSK